MNDNNPQWLSLVREKVETLRYGVVQIVVHDSKVIQIERTERLRFVSGKGTESARRNGKFNRPDMLEVP
jgi:hypothetical protein